jgi:hypothetical protein
MQFVTVSVNVGQCTPNPKMLFHVSLHVHPAAARNLERQSRTSSQVHAGRAIDNS